MAHYKMKTDPIEAVEIDAQWLLFLKNEKGITDAKIGDYFYYKLSGEHEVMLKERFERLFERVEV